jgi:hypothetical protein
MQALQIKEQKGYLTIPQSICRHYINALRAVKNGYWFGFWGYNSFFRVGV